MPFFSCFTRLEGVIPRAVDRMSRLPPRHSFERFTESLISEVRTQKAPLTHRPKLFATALRPLRAFKRHSRQRLSGKSPASPFLALGLSWLSYSRLSDLPIVPEPGQRSGFDCHQCEGSPRRHTLNEPFHPRKKTRRPEPHGRISDLSTASPTLRHDGLDEKRIKVCPHRPHSRAFLLTPTGPESKNARRRTFIARTGKHSVHDRVGVDCYRIER
jgi:hypothetical protein